MPKPPWRDEPYNLGNDEEFIAVDLPNIEWLLSAPRLRQIVVAQNGTPFEMEVPDPRAYMLYKAWLSVQPEREPLSAVVTQIKPNYL